MPRAAGTRIGSYEVLSQIGRGGMGDVYRARGGELDRVVAIRGAKWQISSAGGAYPQFAPNGRELFYRADDNLIMVASYTVTGDAFVADKPRVWSPTRSYSSRTSSTNCGGEC